MSQKRIVTISCFVASWSYDRVASAGESVGDQTPSTEAAAAAAMVSCWLYAMNSMTCLRINTVYGTGFNG